MGLSHAYLTLFSRLPHAHLLAVEYLLRRTGFYSFVCSQAAKTRGRIKTRVLGPNVDWLVIVQYQASHVILVQVWRFFFGDHFSG